MSGQPVQGAQLCLHHGQASSIKLRLTLGCCNVSMRMCADYCPLSVSCLLRSCHLHVLGEQCSMKLLLQAWQALLWNNISNSRPGPYLPGQMYLCQRAWGGCRHLQSHAVATLPTPAHRISCLLASASYSNIPDMMFHVVLCPAGWHWHAGVGPCLRQVWAPHDVHCGHGAVPGHHPGVLVCTHYWCAGGVQRAAGSGR